MRPDTLNWQIALVALIACHHLQLITEARPPLKFHDDHFKILQLADLHYGGFSEDDALTDALQQRLLDVETPDLVVFSGDLVSGYLWNASLGSGWFADRCCRSAISGALLRRAAAPVQLPRPLSK